jgi:hypothetical protein
MATNEAGENTPYLHEYGFHTAILPCMKLIYELDAGAGLVEADWMYILSTVVGVVAGE